MAASSGRPPRGERGYRRLTGRVRPRWIGTEQESPQTNERQDSPTDDGGTGEAASPFAGTSLPPTSRRLTAAGRLALVQFVAEKLAAGHDLPEVLAAVVQGLREALGAEAVTIGAPQRGMLVTLVADGLAATSQELVRDPLALDDDAPATKVLRTGEPIFWTSLEERDRNYPAYAGYPSAHQSWAILPLIVHGSPLGVMSLGWGERRRFGRAEAALLGVVAHLCAAAIDRAVLQDEERRERETLELLGEGTRLMVSALDPDQVVRSLVRLAVPRLAPWCAVYVADRNELRRVALEAASTPGIAEVLGEAAVVATDADSALAVTYRSGETAIIREGDRPDRDGGDPPWTALVVPVKAAGQVIGVMSLASPAWAGEPPAQVRFGAEGLAGRAGVALARARRFDRERRTAALLTQALLPADVQPIEGYDAAARYLPAGSHVAGDWFDLTHLPSDRYLVGIGDAAGHGIRAASLMAQLRNAARGLAVGGNPPSEILHGLGLLAVEDDPESFATAIYGVLEPASGNLVWASAGHIPPLLCEPGKAAFLESDNGTPLGWPTAHKPEDRVTRLRPGDTVVLVTDGVVERRDADLAERLEQLRDLLGDSCELAARTVADRIVRDLCVEPEDDCCVVVLQRLPEAS